MPPQAPAANEGDVPERKGCLRILELVGTVGGAMSESTTNLSAEVKAMGTVGGALEGLDESARQRVLDWASERFGMPDRAHHSLRANHKGDGGKPDDDRVFAAAQQGQFTSIS